MSILIKGMDMPKNCDVCGFKNGCEFSVPLTERPFDCPLVDVREDMDIVDLACWYDENILYPKRIREGRT